MFFVVSRPRWFAARKPGRKRVSCWKDFETTLEAKEWRGAPGPFLCGLSCSATSETCKHKIFMRNENISWQQETPVSKALTIRVLVVGVAVIYLSPQTTCEESKQTQTQTFRKLSPKGILFKLSEAQAERLGKATSFALIITNCGKLDLLWMLSLKCFLFQV